MTDIERTVELLEAQLAKVNGEHFFLDPTFFAAVRTVVDHYRKARLARDCYRAVLAGMEFQDLDALPAKGLDNAKQLGELAGQKILTACTAYHVLKETERILNRAVPDGH